MTNRHKIKGDSAELEGCRVLADLTGWPVERKLGAGRKQDTGDVYGLPQTCVQIKNHVTYDRIPSEVAALERQRANLGCPFAGLMLRYRGGNWIVAMNLDHFTTLLREATGPNERCICGGRAIPDPDCKAQHHPDQFLPSNRPFSEQIPGEPREWGTP